MVFFALIEGGLALFGGAWSALYSGDPGYDWRVRPSLNLAAVPHLEEGQPFAVQTNAQGMRDDALPTTGPWVLALGCSTTFGWGVEREHVWTEVLERSLTVPVVNAGVPGHSSEQGLRLARELIELQPDVVIVGWGLRDGQHAVVPDVDRKPTPFPRNTRLFRLLAGQLGGEQTGDTPRVGTLRFRENIEQTTAIAHAAGARVLLLDMTARSDTPSHGQVLQALELPLLVPKLTDEDYFPLDPIHLNERGNRTLAGQLEAPIRVLLTPEVVAPPPEATPQQTP